MGICSDLDLWHDLEAPLFSTRGCERRVQSKVRTLVIRKLCLVACLEIVQEEGRPFDCQSTTPYVFMHFIVCVIQVRIS
jgi:hypothetical protein